jgi:5-formyltetrahydrofolate cyclo-ligase
MNKQSIRDQSLKFRLALSDSAHRLFSQAICDLFFSTIDLSATKTVHIFLPLLSKKEPDTWLIIDRLTKGFSNIRISIPKVEHENRLINYYFENKDQLKENTWGILEPQFGEVTPSEEIDLVVVPLLAFDLNGHRVGYGKGFYDRFLKECRADCKKIGLSFLDSVDPISDAGIHDVKLDLVITPSGAVRFN